MLEFTLVFVVKHYLLKTGFLLNYCLTDLCQRPRVRGEALTKLLILMQYFSVFAPLKVLSLMSIYTSPVSSIRQVTINTFQASATIAFPDPW